MTFTKVTYTASSRGLFKDVQLTPQKISVLEDRLSRSRTEIKMPNDKWELLLKHCRTIPTRAKSFDSNKLSLDAAIKATLTIQSDKQSENMSFIIDHSDVPVPFQALVSQILALEKTVE